MPKLKTVHRFISLNYQEAQGYSLENLWWVMSSYSIGIHISESHSFENTRTITLTHKDISVTQDMPYSTSLDTTTIGETIHLLNEAYYEKHLENPEEYPLKKWHNMTQAQRNDHIKQRVQNG